MSYKRRDINSPAVHAGKVIGYSVITTTRVRVCVCACVCVCVCERECYEITCVSSLVYWQICPSSIRLNWPQWWRTLIYLAWAPHWSTAQPHNPSRAHTHTPTQSVITSHIGPWSSALNMAELTEVRETMRTQTTQQRFPAKCPHNKASHVYQNPFARRERELQM